MDTFQEEITQAELLDMFLEQFARELHKAMPCKVEAYDSNAQTVDVVPALNRSVPDGDGNYITEKLPKLSAIPVVFPRCGQFGITFPIAVGDYGLIVVCDRNIGAWRLTGNQGDPGDLGMHTLDGAVFIPGFFPDSKPAQSADPNNMVIGSDSNAASQIVIKPGGEIDAGSGATNYVAMADKVLSQLSSIASGISTILSHTHAVSGGVAGVSTNIGSGYTAPGSESAIASSNLKAND